MLYNHITAMPVEAVDMLNCRPGKIFADCTLGGCGHARLILEKIIPDGLLIGVDQDVDAISNAKKILEPFKSNIQLFHTNFEHLPEILMQLNIKTVDGILLDLGFSLHQLEGSGRGFSFNKDEPLDMRMNIESGLKAEDIINTAEEKKLAAIFKEYGEERYARRIARKIVKERKLKKIRSSRRLSGIVCAAVPDKASRSQKIHPATRVFMAIRIAVNKELEKLDSFLDTSVELLSPGGRLCVLSFHSLEDRIVKQKIKFWEKECICPPEFPVCICTKKKIVRSLTRKPLQPTPEEVAANPMARSTKLRAFEKL